MDYKQSRKQEHLVSPLIHIILSLKTGGKLHPLKFGCIVKVR